MKTAVIEAALASGKLPPAAAAAAVAPGTNLRAALERLGATTVLRHPVEIIAFCDEEGLRWALTPSLEILCGANLPQCTSLQLLPSWCIESTWQTPALSAMSLALIVPGGSLKLKHRMGPNCTPCRFGTTFLGSRAVSGSLVKSGLLSVKELGGQGATLAEALASQGFDSSPASIAAIAMRAGSIRGRAPFHRSLGSSPISS